MRALTRFLLLRRAPEILLGAEVYSTPIDIWSVGCIMGELLLHAPVFQAKGELEMIGMVGFSLRLALANDI